MRAVVAGTAVCQRFERPLHLFEFLNLAVELGDVSRCQLLDRLARATAVVPETQKRTDFLDGKAVIAGLPHEAQRVHVGVGVPAAQIMSTLAKAMSPWGPSAVVLLFRLAV